MLLRVYVRQYRKTGCNRCFIVEITHLKLCKPVSPYTIKHIFAAGDDRTDEDMFKFLFKNRQAHTIKAGPSASYAQYNVLKPQMVNSLLTAFNQPAPHLTA